LCNVVGKPDASKCAVAETVRDKDQFEPAPASLKRTHSGAGARRTLECENLSGTSDGCHLSILTAGARELWS
jgi:hypothetical protein